MATIERTSSPINISDKSAIGKTARKKGYRDLDLKLSLHPFRNLILSNFFERPFQPELGANLKALLFEPMDVVTEIALRENIEDVILNHEPRIRLIDIGVKGDIEKNNYNITVKYLIRQSNERGSLQVVLRRLR